MFNMKNKQMIRLSMGLLMIAFSFIPHITMAQDPCDPGGGPGTGGNPCPIDGGIYLLLATGVVYGVYHFHKERKDEKDATEELKC
jgi:hypothetical protein